jgi:hypothetical protein
MRNSSFISTFKPLHISRAIILLDYKWILIHVYTLAPDAKPISRPLDLMEEKD